MDRFHIIAPNRAVMGSASDKGISRERHVASDVGGQSA